MGANEFALDTSHVAMVCKPRLVLDVLRAPANPITSS